MTNELRLALPAELLDQIAELAAERVLTQLAAAPPSPYLTIPEAAEYLRCKRQRIDDLLSAGKLTRHKDGRRTLILRSELEAYIAGRGGPVAVRSDNKRDRRPAHGPRTAKTQESDSRCDRSLLGASRATFATPRSDGE